MLKYSLMLFAALALAPLASAAGTDAAGSQNWQAGKDYFLIQPPHPIKGDKVVITEVFSYACPHCAHFQPYADELKGKLPAGVEFNLVPAIFNSSWEPFARAFYTAKSLGILDKTHQALFDALHRDHQPLRSIQDLANLFYANYGVNPGTFLSTAESFVINGELQNSQQLVRDYQVDGTPTLVIDGKYRVTANGRDIGFPQMVQIALYLANKELSAGKAPPHEAKSAK